MTDTQFTLGDRVKWRCLTVHRAKTFKGTIVAFVPAQTNPSPLVPTRFLLDPDLKTKWPYRSNGSFLVHVDGTDMVRWPKIGALTRID